MKHCDLLTTCWCPSSALVVQGHTPYGLPRAFGHCVSRRGLLTSMTRGALSAQQQQFNTHVCIVYTGRVCAQGRFRHHVEPYTISYRAWDGMSARACRCCGCAHQRLGQEDKQLCSACALTDRKVGRADGSVAQHLCIKSIHPGAGGLGMSPTVLVRRSHSAEPGGKAAMAEMERLDQAEGIEATETRSLLSLVDASFRDLRVPAQQTCLPADLLTMTPGSRGKAQLSHTCL